MKFAIAETSYFNSLGFNTEHWRKSLDGTQAIAHYDFVKHLADDSRLTFYRHDDKAFAELMQSEEWTDREGDVE